MSAFRGWIAQHARERPDHPALISGKHTLSFAELAAAAHSLAGRVRGLGIEAGYRVARLFALGAEFEWTYAFDSNDVPGIGRWLRIGTQNVGIPFRLYPLARLFDPGAMANRLQPFIKLAPTWQWADREIAGQEEEGRGGFVGRMGGGLDIYITENFVFVTSALYNWPTPKIDALGYWSFGAGLQYRFGGGGSGN